MNAVTATVARTAAHTAASIDQLGFLLAQIASLQEQAEVIKNELKDAATASTDAMNAFEGFVFQAKVVQSDRTTVAYAKLVKDIGVSPEIVARYATLSAMFTVKVTSK